MQQRDAETAFGPGDRVQCTKDGPLMHVIATSTHHCHCQWVDAFGVLQRGTFDHRILMHAAVDDPPP